MKKTTLQRNASAYFLALTSTIIFCLLAAGIVYIDICARDTLLSADGVIYPLFDKIIDTATKIFNL